MEYIYVIENKNSGKFYIGRTNNPAARKRGHDALRSLKNFKLTRKSLKKYLPEFGMDFQQVLIRP